MMLNWVSDEEFQRFGPVSKHLVDALNWANDELDAIHREANDEAVIDPMDADDFPVWRKHLGQREDLALRLCETINDALDKVTAMRANEYPVED